MYSRKTRSVRSLPRGTPGRVKPDDRYLVQAQMAVDGSTIVTHDNPLQQALGRAGRRYISREEFLALFPGRG